MDDCIDNEIIALKSIYEDELKIADGKNCKEIKITLTPATAGVEASKYVCLDICIKVPKLYPSSSPEFVITWSRGLSDEYLKELSNRLHLFMDENVGNCVLFDILDSVKEYLTDNNIPSDICSICLYGFNQSADFMKTNCFHYFHRYCIKNYKDYVSENSVDGILRLIEDTDKLSIKKSTVKVPCPVCKTPCDIDMDSLSEASPPEDEEVIIDYELLRKQRQEFDEMYRLQLEKDGVIDLDKERNKYLLSNLQKTYDAYIASGKARSNSPNDSETSTTKSVTRTASSSSKSNHRGSGSRGRWTSGGNFTPGYHQNYSNHLRFHGNQNRNHHEYADGPCSSSQAQGIANERSGNKTHDCGAKSRGHRTKDFRVKRSDGYHNAPKYDAQSHDPPRCTYPNRGGGYGQRRPYRGSWTKRKANNFSRSKTSQDKTLEKSEM